MATMFNSFTKAGRLGTEGEVRNSWKNMVVESPLKVKREKGLRSR
jgi:hypothetical protein